MGKTERNKIELYFEWWLDDAMKYGYVDSYTRESESFKLFQPFKGVRLKYHKTKLPTSEGFNLLPGANYTFDYKIHWNKKAEFIFYNPTDFITEEFPVMIYPDTFFWAQETAMGDFISYVDVKPPSKAAKFQGNLSSFHTFPFVQKTLLEKFGVYVQKVVPIPMTGSGLGVSLFPNTYTPSRYFFTDGGQQQRKIKFRILNLELYVKLRREKIEKLNKYVRNVEDKTAKQGDIFNGS